MKYIVDEYKERRSRLFTNTILSLASFATFREKKNEVRKNMYVFMFTFRRVLLS